MKNNKSKPRTHLIDIDLDRCMEIEKSEIKPDIERLIKQKQSQISYQRLCLFRKIIE
jgi:hypothetical protein